MWDVGFHGVVYDGSLVVSGTFLLKLRSQVAPCIS